MREIIFSAIFFLGFCFNSFSAENNTHSEAVNDDYTRNIVFGKANVWIMGQAYQIAYERLISVGKAVQFSAHASYGYWKDIYEDGNLFSISANYLLGRKNHMFEVNLGLLAKVHYDQYYTDQRKFDHFNFLPDLFVGYRYKKPNGHFMFKAGAGFPSLASVGLGFCF